MNLHVAKALILNDGLNYNKRRLPWLPKRLYRKFMETMPHGS